MAGKPKELGTAGFTLVELMLGVAIAGIVMASFYSVYISQQSSYLRQEEVAAMQQNIRSALFYMGRDIRMAGLDPTRRAGAGIVQAKENLIQITEDLWGEDGNGPPDGDIGDTQEDITYALADMNGDGRENELVRRTGGQNNLIAENIKSLDFGYLDRNGDPIEDTSFAIRFVEVTLRAVSKKGSREQIMTARINCRNLGY